MKQGGSETAKRNAGESAASVVEDGQVVGLGTGSTAAHAIRAIGRRVADGLDVTGIPTSFQARELALEAGIALADLDRVGGDLDVDISIDGADQIVDDTLIKGGGGAHALEKVVDTAADRFLVVVDPTKESTVLDHTIPVEVVPAARTVVARHVRRRGSEPTLRRAACKDGPVVTSNGNLILDCDFGHVDDPSALARDLSVVPGVLEHGLFVGVVDEVHLGTEDGVSVRQVEY